MQDRNSAGRFSPQPASNDFQIDDNNLNKSVDDVYQGVEGGEAHAFAGANEGVPEDQYDAYGAEYGADQYAAGGDPNQFENYQGYEGYDHQGYDPNAEAANPEGA